MKIKRIRIENFRCWKDQTIELDRYNCFVGANGAGKSAVLLALNLFFRHTQNSPTNVLNLQEEDFYQKDTTQSIKITVTFDDLRPEAQEDLKAYYRQGELTVHTEAVWDSQSHTAAGQHYGSRRIMVPFSPYFEADEANVPATGLKTIFKTVREAYPDLPSVSTKDAMRSALRDYEETHPDLCELSRSNDQFYGWSKGANALQKYVQWVYIPAVKDASMEQDETKTSALGQLLERTIRQNLNFLPDLEALRVAFGKQYKDILDTNRDALGAIADRLTSRLRTWSSPRSEFKLDWQFDDQRSVTFAPPTAHAQAGEDSFLGEVSRLGHGLQRSYLVALLQELAEQKGAEAQPTLILGFEEPELYQHPPQAKYLRAVLEDLSEKGSQILITTHSPHLVSSQGFVAVRRVTKERGAAPQSKAAHATVEQVSSSLAQALGCEPPPRSKVLADIEQIMEPSLSELYFCDVAILVEGSEDVAYLTAHLALTNQLDWFRRLGCHFVICRGKTNISRPLAIAKCLQIPAYTFFDSDTDKKKDLDREARDNGCLLALTGNADQDPRSANSIFTKTASMLSPNLTVAVREEYGSADWETLSNEVRKKFGLGDGVSAKNAYLIAHCLEAAYEKQGPSKILEGVTALIRAYAEDAHAPAH
jgi:energy-coupling factor transporter ATP-binding protein EcfA2